jgi:Transposase DDE domain
LRHELAATGLSLVAPFRNRSRDPDPASSRRLTRLRWRIETVAGQFVDRYHLKRVRARDTWHVTARIYRKVLRHTLGVLLAPDRQRPLALARLTA